ncbi:MAG: alpha/beta hydrolase [Duganella sp.]
MTLVFDPQALEQACAFNRKLAWLPRFKITNRVMPVLVQSLLQLSQVNADGKLRRAGVSVVQRRVQVDEQDVPVKVRILRAAQPRPPRGVVIDFHGGGWAIGNAAMNDQLNAELVAACDVVVVSVDYRLATFTPLASIMDDCLVAARWLLAGGLPDCDGLPVCVVGESAGGHLAAATLLRLKAWPVLLAKVAGAVLYYGVYDLAGTARVRAAGPETLLLHGPTMQSSMRLLTPGLSDAERRQAPLSPLYGDLSGLPPALLFAGDRDPLRDDTMLMAQAWRQQASAPVECHMVPEAAHGFIRFPIAMAAMVRQHVHAWISQRCASAA